MKWKILVKAKALAEARAFCYPIHKIECKLSYWACLVAQGASKGQITRLKHDHNTNLKIVVAE